MFSIADIDKEARKRLYGAPQVASVDEARMSSGAPLFSRDEVHRTPHYLDILFRSLCVRKRITREYLNAKCREYALNHGYLPAQASTFGSNLVRTLLMGNITFSRFQEALQVLDMNIVDMTVQIKSASGLDESFSIQDSIEFAQSEHVV